MKKTLNQVAQAVSEVDLRIATENLGAWRRRQVQRGLNAAARHLGMLPPEPGEALARRAPHPTFEDGTRDEHKTPDERGTPDENGAQARKDTVMLLQATWLRLRGAAFSEQLTQEAISERYWRKIGEARSEEVPGPTTYGMLALVLLGVLMAVLWLEPQQKPNWVSSGGLWHVGERLDTALEESCAEAIGAWNRGLEALNRVRGEVENSERLLAREGAFAGLDEGFFAGELGRALAPVEGELRQVLEQLRAFGTPESTLSSGPWGEEVQWEASLTRQVMRLNAMLYEHSLPYAFEARAGFQDGVVEAALELFVLQGRRRYTAERQPIEILYVSELGARKGHEAGRGSTVLGERAGPMGVRLDRLGQALIRDLGPALAPQGVFELPQRRARATGVELGALERQLGTVIRRTFTAAFPRQTEDLSALGEALVHRQDLFESWNLKWAEEGHHIQPPPALGLEPEMWQHLEHLASPNLARVLRSTQERLEAPEMLRLVEAMTRRWAYAESQGRIQRRLDQREGRWGKLRLPAGVPVGKVGPNPDGLRQASLLLGQMARDPSWAQLSLTVAARPYYQSEGTVESWAFGFVIAQLAEELGWRGAEAPGHLSFEQGVALHRRLSAVLPEALAEQARAAWERIFQAPWTRTRVLWW